MSSSTSDVKLFQQSSIELDKSLNQLAGKMSHCCANPGNRETLVKYITEVGQDYISPSEYSIVNTFYSCFRVRAKDLELLLSELKNLNPTTWLEGLHRFMDKGAWTSTSANTQLFEKIIRAVPGYDKEEIDYVLENKYEYIKAQFQRELTTYISQHRAAEQRIRKRKQELVEYQKAAKEKELANISDVSLEILKTGDVLPNNYTHEKRFLVTMQKNKSGNFELIWHDELGEKELIGFRAEQNIEKIIRAYDKYGIKKFSNKQQNEVKLFCQSAITSKLSAVRLAFSEKQARDIGNVFLIEHKDPTWSVSWFDSTNKKVAVNLKQYPKLDEFLQKLTESDLSSLKDEKNVKRQTLQMFLLRYRKPVMVIEEGLKSNALKMLRAQHGVALVCTSDLKAVKKYQLIEGTYFLTKVSDKQDGFRWELYQRKDKEFSFIETSNWKLFNKTLNELEGKSPEDVKAIKPKNGKSPFDILRGVIKSAEDGTLLNLAVDLDTVDSLEKLEKYQAIPDSYVIYQGKEGLIARYYDTLGKGLDIDTKKEKRLKPLHELLASLNRVKPSELSAQQLESIASLLEGVKPREKVKTTLQLNVKDILQQRHGITLICTNDLSKVPKYKLIDGTYFLTKNHQHDGSSWQLYVRKNRKFISVDILQWRTAQIILSNVSKIQPEDLSTTDVINPLRKFIKAVEDKLKVNLILFDSCQEFKSHKKVANSYVLYKDGKQFKLGYFNKDLEYTVLKASKVEGLKEIIKSQKELLPSQITDEQLDAVERALASGVNKTLVVVGVDDIDSHKATPDTYAIYKENDRFCLRYYDTLNKPIEIETDKVSGLDELLQEQATKAPSQLKDILNPIAELLMSFKPNSKLDIGSFKDIEKALKGLSTTKAKMQETGPGKLNMSDFKCLANVFGGESKREVQHHDAAATRKQPESDEMKAKKALLATNFFNTASEANNNIPPAPPLPDEKNDSEVIQPHHSIIGESYGQPQMTL